MTNNQQRPSLFVASSTEQLALAYAVQQELEHDADPTVWKQGIFKASQSSLVSLLQQLGTFDFGVFVFAPDDVTSMRGTASTTVRDNVIFELGLFIGRLSAERCFIVVPRGVEGLHLPTDLIGFTPLEYHADRSDGNLRAALGPACNDVRDAVKKLGARNPSAEFPDKLPKDTLILNRIMKEFFLNQLQIKLFALIGMVGSVPYSVIPPIEPHTTEQRDQALANLVRLGVLTVTDPDGQRFYTISDRAKKIIMEKRLLDA
ncbi:MAG: nucleotide-binding protein [Candidatus Methylophosphatis roskildensis]